MVNESLDYPATKQFLQMLIGRTKNYMGAEAEANYLPTEEDFDSKDNRLVEEKIKRHNEKRRENELLVEDEVKIRTALISEIFKGDVKKNRSKLYKNAKRFLEENTLSEEEKIIIEYELTFCGINYPDGRFFEPYFFRNIGKPDCFLAHYQDSNNNLFMTMHQTEHARRHYSLKEYGGKDLSEVIWCREKTFDELEDDVKRFVKGKEKILEVGFLHQRLYNQIMEASPSIQYYGIDIAIPAIIQARRKGIRVYNCNAWYAIPFDDKFFDGIISSTIKASGLWLNPEMKRVLKDKRRILNFNLQ